MEEAQFEEDFEKYLNEALISCEKCHFCHTVCPIVDTRVTQGPFGINRAIYYGLQPMFRTQGVKINDSNYLRIWFL